MCDDGANVGDCDVRQGVDVQIRSTFKIVSVPHRQNQPSNCKRHASAESVERAVHDEFVESRKDVMQRRYMSSIHLHMNTDEWALGQILDVQCADDQKQKQNPPF